MNLAPNCPLEEGPYEATLPCGQKFISKSDAPRHTELPLHIITKRIGWINSFGGDIEEIINELESNPGSVKKHFKQAMEKASQEGKNLAETCLTCQKADWKWFAEKVRDRLKGKYK